MTIIRVSEEDQLKGYGPDVQGEHVDGYLLEAGLLEHVRRVINEESTTWNRPRFEAILTEAIDMHARGEIVGIVFPRRNRLARYGSAGGYYLGLLDRAGLEIHFAKEGRKYEPRDPDSFDWVMKGLSQAQQDADEIRSNTVGGRRKRAEKDHKMPTGGHKWAFDYDPATGHYTRNSERAAWIPKCDEWIWDEGCSLNECCRRLRRQRVMTPGFVKWMTAVEAGREWKKRRPPEPYKWVRGTLRAILIDEANIGKFYAYMHKRANNQNGRKKVLCTKPEDWLLVYEDPSQAIRTPERHEAIKAKLRLNQEASRRNNNKHWYPPVRRMVYCVLCGVRMHGVTIKGIPYYRCDVCKNVVNMRNVWNELQQEIRTRLLEPDFLVPGIKAQLESGKTLERLSQEKDGLERDKERWSSARQKARRLYFIKKDYTEEKYLADDRDMEEQERKIAGEIGTLESQIRQLQQAIIDEEGITKFCQEAAQNLECMDDARWRVLLERMRVGIDVAPGEKVKVHISLPTIKEPECEIAYQTSRCCYRLKP
jgi:hypothetical protein